MYCKMEINKKKLIIFQLPMLAYNGYRQHITLSHKEVISPLNYSIFKQWIFPK